MSYTALYRKFRPLTFSEIVGQEHITKTLKNQIMAGRVGHAYLFNGGRGTGKTTAAKVLARAVNCLNPQDGEPCNECEICKAALAGSLTDIVEMDAASNNSVEDIRSIREEVNFLPTLAKYRVYIIDEVHMLSTGAFNALLKTLEEPPAHVKFILATTEPQKLPATILSRCQRFDFKKISNDDVVKRLEYVAKESNIEITKEALNLIAILSEGAMRDALSILERCLQDGESNINEDKIKDLVGIPKLTYIHAIVKAFLEYDVENAIKAVDTVLNEGKDLNNLLWEIIKYVKDILVYKATGKLEIYSNEELEEIKKLAGEVTKERLLYIITDLSKLENDMKWSSQKSILFQVEIIKLCSENIIEPFVENVNKGNKNQGKTADNMSNTTNQAFKANAEGQKNNGQGEINGTAQLANSQGMTNGAINQSSNQLDPKQVQKQNLAQAISEFGEAKGWKNILNELRQNGKVMLYSNLLKAKAIEINDMTIGISFPEGLNSFGKSILEKPENITELSKIVSMEYGKDMKVRLVENADSLPKKNIPQKSQIETIASDLDIPINVIE